MIVRFATSGARRRRLARWSIMSLAAAGVGCAMARAREAPRVASRLPVRDVRLHAASGSTIHGWLAPGTPGRGAVLLLHGVGASHRAMLGRAEFLHAAGFTVLALDFQARGASARRHATYGALESRDAATGLAFLRAEACGERVGVIGISMGGAAALLGDGPLAVDALVLESVYPTIRHATAGRLGHWLGPLGRIGRWATPAALRVNGWRIGVAERELRPIERIGAVSAPLLLVAGTADPYTPPEESRALFARVRAPGELWLVERATHEDLHAFAGAEYERRVGGFLSRHLARSDSASASAASAAGVASAVPVVAVQREQRPHAGQAPQCLDDRERRGEG